MQRINSLDGLRAYACLIVIFFHVQVPAFKHGHIGVDVFFVLSGYLITSIILSELNNTGKFDYLRFQSRRMLRLFPALLAMIILYLIVGQWLFPTASVINDAFLALSYTSNLSFVAWRIPSYIFHTWSLSLEVQFYLIWPVVLCGIWLIAPNRILQVLILLFVAATIWRFWIQYSGQNINSRVYVSFATRLTGFIIGAIISQVKLDLSDKQSDVAMIFALAGLAYLVNGNVIAQFGMVKQHYYWYITYVEILSAIIILCLISGAGRLQIIFNNRVAVVLGAWSYSMYLWHYPIVRYTRINFDLTASLIITLSLSIVLSALTYELVEKRMTNKVKSWLSCRSKKKVSTI